ncbi:MAG: response regulator [Desulfobacterales bacterium]
MAAKKKILVVDDDRVILTFAGRLLEREGHEVLTAGDGFEALNVLSDFTPEIIFFDLIMPKIDGDKLIAIIRGMLRLKECFLVIVSAVVAETDFDFQATGADYYIAKGPFSAMADNFLAAIRAADEPRRRDAPKPVVGLDYVYSRQLTRELLSRNRHLETILESMAEGILELFNGQIVYANSAAAALLGMGPEKFLTARPAELFEGPVRERLESLLSNDPGGPAAIGENTPLEVNGRLLTVMKLPVRGDETTVMLMITDTTERRRLEAQVQHAQKMEAIGTIAAGVAHNFRNTLTEILVNSQLIQFNFKGEPQLQEITERVHTSVKRGARLVDGLLHFSRKQIGKEFTCVDLAPVIRQAGRVAAKTFDAGIKVCMELPEPLPVSGDPAGLSQVFMNLFNNARDAMPMGGTLTVEGRREGSQIVVRVSDTGLGMDPETLEKCFDPFFTTKPIGKGTGLGLSTAYGIVKSHDGTIGVRSAPGAGTSFRLQFPPARPEETPAPEPAASLVHGRGQRILLVDDETDINLAMKGLLNKLNYQSASAQSGEEAVALYREYKPTAVLLDIYMPGMDGLECARRILDADPAARIVILSGCEPVDPRLKDLLERKLVKGVLTKPVGISELSCFLAEVLER